MPQYFVTYECFFTSSLAVPITDDAAVPPAAYAVVDVSRIAAVSITAMIFLNEFFKKSYPRKIIHYF